MNTSTNLTARMRTAFSAASLATALILGGCGVVSAQTSAQTTPAAHAHHRNAYMEALHGLALSDGQKAQIKDIVAKTHAANKGATDPAVKKANNATMRQQISALLTADQQAQFKANMKAERRASAGQRGANAPSAIPTAAASPAP
jgi:Spy/CpxP family protein refolding chaperone